LILAKASAMRVSIALVLSTRVFIALPRTLTSFTVVVPPSSYSFPSLISSTLCLNGTWCAYIFKVITFTGFTVHHDFSVTFFPVILVFCYCTIIKSSKGRKKWSWFWTDTWLASWL
jgi:hypothetical protein